MNVGRCVIPIPGSRATHANPPPPRPGAAPSHSQGCRCPLRAKSPAQTCAPAASSRLLPERLHRRRRCGTSKPCTSACVPRPCPSLAPSPVCYPSLTHLCVRPHTGAGRAGAQLITCVHENTSLGTPTRVSMKADGRVTR